MFVGCVRGLRAGSRVRGGGGLRRGVRQQARRGESVWRRRRGFAATKRARVQRAGAQEGCVHRAVARRRRALSCIGAAAQSVLRHEHLDISGTGARYATSFRPAILRLTRGTNPYRLDAAARNLLRRVRTDVIQQLDFQRRHQVTGCVDATRSMAARGSALMAEAGRRRRLCAGAAGRAGLRAKQQLATAHINKIVVICSKINPAPLPDQSGTSEQSCSPNQQCWCLSWDACNQQHPSRHQQLPRSSSEQPTAANA